MQTPKQYMNQYIMSSIQGAQKQYYENIHKLTLIQNKLSDEFINILIKISEMYIPSIDFNANNECIVLFDVLTSQMACCLAQGTRMDQIIIITICGQLMNKLNNLSQNLQKYQGYYQQQVFQVLLLGLQSESIELKTSWTYMLLEILQTSKQLIKQNILSIIYALIQSDNIRKFDQNNKNQIIQTQKISQQEYLLQQQDYITVIIDILDSGITLTQEEMNNLWIKLFKINKGNWRNICQFYDQIFDSIDQSQTLELLRGKMASGIYDEIFIHILSTIDPQQQENNIDDAKYLSCLLLCLQYLDNDQIKQQFNEIIIKNEDIIQNACIAICDDKEGYFNEQIEQVLEKTENGILIIKCKPLFDIMGQSLINTIFSKMTGEYIEQRWFGITIPNEENNEENIETNKVIRSKFYNNSLKFIQGLKDLEPNSYLEYFLDILNNQFQFNEEETMNIKIFYSSFKMILEDFGIDFFGEQFIYMALQCCLEYEEGNQVDNQFVVTGRVLFLLAFREYIGDKHSQQQLDDIKQIMYKLLTPQQKLNIFDNIDQMYENTQMYVPDIQNLALLLNITHEMLAIADKEMKSAEIDKLYDEIADYYGNIGVNLLTEAQDQKEQTITQSRYLKNIISYLDLKFKSPSNKITSTLTGDLYVENTYLTSYILLKLGVLQCIYTNQSIQWLLNKLLSYNYEEQTSAVIHIAVFCLKNQPFTEDSQYDACTELIGMVQQNGQFSRDISLQLSACLPLISLVQRLGTKTYSQQSNIVAAPIKALISQQSVLDMIEELEHTNKYVLTNDQQTGSQINDLVQALKRQLKLQDGSTKFLEIGNQIITLISQDLGEAIIKLATQYNDQLPLEQITSQEPEICLNCIIDRQDDDLSIPTLTQLSATNTIDKYLYRTTLEHAINIFKQRLSVMKISKHSIEVVKQMFSVCQMVLQGQVEYYATLLKVTTVNVNQFDNLSDYLDIISSKLSLFLVCDQNSNITDVLIDIVNESLQVILQYKKEFDNVEKDPMLDEVADNGILLQWCTQAIKLVIQQAYSNHVTKNFEFASLHKIISIIIQNTNTNNIILLKQFSIALDAKINDIDQQLVKQDLFQLLLFIQLLYADELIQLVDFNIEYITTAGIQTLYTATANYNALSQSDITYQALLNLIFTNEVIIKQNMIKMIRRANKTYKFTATTNQIFEEGIKSGNIIIVYLLLSDMMNNIDLSYKDKLINLYATTNIQHDNLMSNYVYLHFLEQIGLVSDKLFNLILRQQNRVVLSLFSNVVNHIIQNVLDDANEVDQQQLVRIYQIGSKELLPSHFQYYVANFINIIDQIVSVQKNTSIIQEIIKILIKVVIQNINVDKLQVQVVTIIDCINQLLLSLLKHQNLQLSVDQIQLEYIKELIKILFRKQTPQLIKQQLIYLLSMISDNQSQILTRYFQAYTNKLFIVKDEDIVNKVIKSTQKALEINKQSSYFIKQYGVFILESQKNLSQVFCEIDNCLYQVFYNQFIDASQQYLKHEYYTNIFAAYYEAKIDAITVNNLQVAMMPQLCLYYVYRQVLYDSWFENVIETIEIDGNSAAWWKQILELRDGVDIIDRLE